MAEESTTFPTLYGRDKSNKIKQWDIKVVNKGTHSLLMFSYGMMGGKRVECKQEISLGKNLGKKNETTHYQQAILDAQSRWNKKKDTDKYTTNKDALGKQIDDQTNKCAAGSDMLLPMLAQEYSKHAKKVTFPCYIQPKLDGYRMVFDPVTKKVYTRTGKEYVVIYQTELYQELKEYNMTLDGELYVHDLDFKFENYGVLRKTKALTDAEHQILARIEYHVYDVIDTTMEYEKRLDLLRSKNDTSKMKFVKTEKCYDTTDVDKYHQQFVQSGYEGSMLRNSQGKYRCKFRSYDLFKKKDFDDDEFTITGYTNEKDITGHNQDLVVWICKTPSGQKFNVQSKGTREQRHDLFKNGNQYIGRKLWVQYFGLTADGIPRFPKTLHEGVASIRDIVM